MRISIRVGENYVYTDTISPIENSVTSVRPLEPEKPAEETFAAALEDESAKLEKAAVSPEDMATTKEGYESMAPAELQPYFKEAATTYGLDQKFLELVGYHESGFKSGATSSSGAMGIMQLMPATAQSLGVSNPYDARENIMGGAKLLKQYYDDYQGNIDLMLAAYNAGAGAVRKYGGVPPYTETTNYVNWFREHYTQA